MVLILRDLVIQEPYDFPMSKKITAAPVENFEIVRASDFSRLPLQK